MKTLPFLGRVLTLSVPLQAFSVLIKWQTLPRWLRITMYKLPCTIVQNLNVKKKRLKSILEKRENKKHQPFNRGFFWLARCVLRKKKKNESSYSYSGFLKTFFAFLSHSTQTFLYHSLRTAPYFFLCPQDRWMLLCRLWCHRWCKKWFKDRGKKD